jgi:hypothetical protein
MATIAAKPLKRNAKQVAHKAKRATSNEWVERLERFGYLVRGLIYFIIGALAAQLAIGAGGATTDQTGAIAFIGNQPLGKALLVLVAVGLTGYSLWGFVRAVFDPLGRGTAMKGILERIGFFVSGLSYGALVIPTVQFVINRPGAQPTGNPAGLSAQLFAKPFGPWLVVGFGLFWIVAAAGQFYSAYTAHFAKDFDTNTMRVAKFKWARRIGRFGFAARGVVFGLIGLFVLQAGLTMDPHKAQSFDAVLLKIAQAPYGPILLAVVAFGLVAFGVYSALCASWNKVG